MPEHAVLAPLQVEEARAALSQLLLDTERGALREIAKGKSVAALVPVTTLSKEVLIGAPDHNVTKARRNLGDLVTAAAAGRPQLIKRRNDIVGALVPITMAGRGRRLTAIGDVLDRLGAGASTPHLTTGLVTLDEATGGLTPGEFVIVAAPPGAGGSLLVAGAARAAALPPDDAARAGTAQAAALTSGLPVLYAASGLTGTDVTTRIVAAEAGVDYRRMRAGALQQADRDRVLAAEARLRTAMLHIDGGGGLTAEMIADTAQYVPGLALIVIDRLQHAPDAELPLSGDALVDATATLTRVARDLNVPILAAYDNSTPQALARLTAHAVWILSRNGQVEVSHRDFGTTSTISLTPDLARARFLDGQPAAAGSAATPPAPAPRSRTTEAVKQPTAAAPEPETASASPSVPRTQGDAVEAAGKRPRNAAAGTEGRDTRERSQHELVGWIQARVQEAREKCDGDENKTLQFLVRNSVSDVMTLFDLSRVGGRYEHTVSIRDERLSKPSQKKSDQIWEGRPKWTNPEVQQAVHNGQALEVHPLDVNAAYLTAFTTFLPIGRLEPDNSRVYTKERSGIYLVTPPAWKHKGLPNPLGARKEPGEVWITTPTLRLLLRCHEKFELCDAPVIHEAYTSGASEYLIHKLRLALAEVRMESITSGDKTVYEYVKDMYSKFVSTLGESHANRDIRRPDWMHMFRSQAFMNIWLRAYKLHQVGVTLVEMKGTDELHVAGNWREVFKEGRALTEMKIKPEIGIYTLGR